MKQIITFCLITLLLLTSYSCSNNAPNEKIDNTIDEYITQKIQKQNLEDNNEKVDFAATVHETLKTKEKDDEIIYYIYFLYTGYEFENKSLVYRNGESGIATVSLKRVSDKNDDYKITKFEQGFDKKTAYSLNMIPTTKQEAKENEKKNDEREKKLQKLNNEKAREYLKEIGSDAKLKTEEDY